ncbi:Hypothetical predicted protein, partial [Paramuricea clavata]
MSLSSEENSEFARVIAVLSELGKDSLLNVFKENELTLKCCDNSGNYKRTCTVKVDSEHIKRSGTHFSTSRLRLFKIDPAFNSLIVVFEVCWRAPHSNSRLSPPA